MNNTKIQYAFTAIMICSLFCLGARGKNTTQIKRLSKAPVIDGTVNVVEWQGATTFNLRKVGSGNLKNAGKAYIGYDDVNLYFAFICQERQINKVRAKYKNAEEHDNAIWYDDCVEIFLAPYGNSHDYYQIIVNTVNVGYDAYAGNSLWDGSFKSAVTLGENSWSVEILIPLVSLGVSIKDGDQWLINLGREQKPDQELSSINPHPRNGCFSSNMIPVRFGKPQNGISLLGVNANRQNQVELLLTNPAKTPKTYLVEAKIVGSSDKEDVKKSFAVPTGKTLKAILPYKGGKQIQTLDIKVSDDSGKLYENQFVIPSSLAVSFRTWQVENPLYEELLPKTKSTGKRVIMWDHILDKGTVSKEAVQYGFPYSQLEWARHGAEERFYSIRNHPMTPVYSKMFKPYGVISQVSAFPLYRTADKWSHPKFYPLLLDPNVEEAYLKAVQWIIDNRKKYDISQLNCGDETAEAASFAGVRLFEKLSDKYPFIKQLDAEVKEKYGDGRFGIPNSVNDDTAGRWIAWHNYVSDFTANLMHKSYKMVKKQAPELEVLSYDPVAPNICLVQDPAKWRGAFDIATVQAYPSTSPLTGRFSMGVKKLRDLSMADDMRPCAHVENYAANFTLDEVRALLSHAVAAGANGWQLYLMDVRGRRSGVNHLFTESLGAPERYELIMEIARNTPQLQYPEADCAMYSSTVSGWSSYRRNNTAEVIAYTLLGPNARLWFDFINETIMTEKLRDLSKYNAIFVYDAPYEDAKAVKALDDYVRNGGTLVVLDPFSFGKDRFGDSAEAAQQKLFGLTIGQKITGRQNFMYKNKEVRAGIPSFVNLNLGSSSKVLARFANHKPAIVETRIGRGRTIVFAFNACARHVGRNTNVRTFFKNFVKQLNLKTDRKIWRFMFPDTMVKRLPRPQGKCITNNHILWRSFTPLTMLNEDVGGSYSYSRKPDIWGEAKISDIPFAEGKLTNRRKAPTAGNVDLGKGKLQDWAVMFNTNREMAVTFDFKKIMPIDRVEVIYQYLLPASVISISDDGKTWKKMVEKPEQENTPGKAMDVWQSVYTLPGTPSTRFVRIEFAKATKRGRLMLSEIDVWSPNNQK
jgi:hypothetical protein